MADRPFAIEEWYYDIPIVTRTYMTLVGLTSLACHLELVTPFHLFYYWPLIYKQRQYWRFFTTFLYFGNFSLDWFFHVYFLLRYLRWFEESRFRGKRLDFGWTLFLLGSWLVILASIFDKKKQAPFLSTALSCAISYIWGRHNPDVRMSLMGLFTFSAPYLPYVMVGFSLILGSRVPIADVLGIITGHIFYYFDHIYPRLPLSNGIKPLATPAFLSLLFGEQENLENPVLVDPPVIGGQEEPAQGQPEMQQQDLPTTDLSNRDEYQDENSLRQRRTMSVGETD